MTWEKQAPYEGLVYQGCLSCPPVMRLAPLDMLIGVGFGSAIVQKDNEPVFNEGYDSHFYNEELVRLLYELSLHGHSRWDGIPILADIEELARHDPDHSWIVSLQAPLRGRTYQRHGPGQWVLIESNRGFA